MSAMSWLDIISIDLISELNYSIKHIKKCIERERERERDDKHLLPCYNEIQDFKWSQTQLANKE